MAHQQQSNVIDQVMELLIDNGFDSMADVMKILFNEAMKIEREEALDARSSVSSLRSWSSKRTIYFLFMINSIKLRFMKLLSDALDHNI